MFYAMFFAMIGAAAALSPGDHLRTLQVDGRERTYLMHLPPNYDAAKPTPVVLAFHGGLTNADIMVRFSGLSEKADAAGFVVVYPNGTGQQPRLLTWNGGNCCGYAARHDVDDVAFVRAVLDDLAQVVNVDPKRVYATGMSNGAILSFRLADEMADRFAAIAAVGGPMGKAACSPNRAVPVLYFHGTEDEYVPIGGGRGPKSRSHADFYSVEHTVGAWVKANGCREAPNVEKLPSAVDDGTSVVRKTYGGGRDGAEVVLYLIEGGGHTWPGRSSWAFYLGKTTKNLSANDVMWEFFEKHRRN